MALVTHPYMLIASMIFTVIIAESSTSASGQEYIPVGSIEYRLLQAQGNGDAALQRRSAPYQQCSMCKCCIAGAGAASSSCATMRCCFSIDCHLPNKPFGVCGFVPKACNCNSCAT
ncbi:hypothetical protein PTKIN_Ptkin07bG0030400 [Pterospermum kingtungense]